MGFDKLDELEEQEKQRYIPSSNPRLNKKTIMIIGALIIIIPLIIVLYVKITNYISWSNREKYVDNDSMRQSLQGEWVLKKVPESSSRRIISGDQYIWVEWVGDEEHDLLMDDSITWCPDEGIFIACGDKYEVKKGGKEYVRLNDPDKSAYIMTTSSNEEFRCSWCGKVIRYNGYNIHSKVVLNGNTLECDYCGHKTNYK